MIKSYIINLARDTERMAFMRRRFEEIGLDYTRADAVDGRRMSDEERRYFAQTRTERRPSWLPGQIGCFLSHFGVWQTIAGGADAFGAVFEDDVHLSKAIKDVLADDAWLPAACDIVRLETSPNRMLLDRTPAAMRAGRALYRLRSTSWCAGAYILSRDCAQRLVSLPAAQHDVLDYFLFSHEESPLAKELVTYQFSPALATQDKFLAEQGKTVGFFSNIETNTVSGAGRLAALCKKLTPATIGRALYKSAKGFQYVRFQP